MWVLGGGNAIETSEYGLCRSERLIKTIYKLKARESTESSWKILEVGAELITTDSEIIVIHYGFTALFNVLNTKSCVLSTLTVEVFKVYEITSASVVSSIPYLLTISLIGSGLLM